MILQRALLGLLIATPLLSLASTEKVEIPQFEFDQKSQKVIYQGTIAQKDSMTGLFFKGFSWLVNNFEEPYEVMETQDQKKGLLTGRATFEVQFSDLETGTQDAPQRIGYDFRIECFEGKYYYLITNIRLMKDGYYGIENWIMANETMYDSRTRSYLVQVHGYMQEMVGLLKAEMAYVEPEPSDDWESQEAVPAVSDEESKEE